jgi:hypothetical protein
MDYFGDKEEVDAPFEDSFALDEEGRLPPMIGRIIAAAVIIALASVSALFAAGSLPLPL